MAEATRASRRTEARLASLLRTLREGAWEPGKIAGWDQEEADRHLRKLCETGLKIPTLPLAAVSYELLAANQPDTVRGNMYQGVSRGPKGLLPDTGKKCYGRVQRLLVYLRENGVVPYEWVVDNVRDSIAPRVWANPADYVGDFRDGYRLDYWSRLPVYVVIVVEKDTIAGKLENLTLSYRVPMHPIRGYNSTSYCWQIARGWDGINKPIIVYYIGDHDPSGRDLERDVKPRLRKYSKHDFRWKRLAVNPLHFRQFNISPLAPKKKDRRTKKFVAEWGRDCAEVEAIPATDLRAMVRTAIVRHIPEGAWERLQRLESQQQDRLEQAIDAMTEDREDDEDDQDEEEDE
jgi:hypothetical protein